MTDEQKPSELERLADEMQRLATETERWMKAELERLADELRRQSPVEAARVDQALALLRREWRGDR